ncbi:MAG: SLC13 family permease [Phycisphaerales bacterium]|nr:SLC13 family permease [Phycisphaerales bacterium]
MTMEMWITLGVLCLLVGFLLFTRVGTDVAVVGSLVLLMLFGIISTEDAVLGFVKDGPLMIGGLFVVAAGMRETGAIERLAKVLLGRPKSLISAQFRLMAPVGVLSGFMNTTPIVAMYLPIVSDWARRMRLSPSRLYMPLSFAGILGGQLTLVGTASNLVVMTEYVPWIATPAADWARELGSSALSSEAEFWGVAVTGIPACILGMVFIAFFSRWLLPDRIKVKDVAKDARRYEVVMRVEPSSPIVGSTIEAAGLRSLPGLYLFGIERDGNILHAVGADEVLRSDDRLMFAGILESVVDLRRIRGLVPAEGDSGLEPDRRVLVEAVVSSDAPFIGSTVRESRFRSTYGAAIIGAFRSGERLPGKIGDLRLKPGDTLLLDAGVQFTPTHRDSPDFYLVSTVSGTQAVKHERAWVACLILILLIIGLMTADTTGLSRVLVVWLAALAMIGTRCVNGGRGRSSINWQVLLTIGGAIGLGAAVKESGLSAYAASAFLDFVTMFGESPRLVLFSMIIATSLLAQLITNYASATIMFTVAMSAAEMLGLRPEPFVFALMAGAGCNFLSPLSYQTNLMVYGPGGYRFTDFARLGVPLLLIVSITATALIPLVFPFEG